jgi:hypothetical protein
MANNDTSPMSAEGGQVEGRSSQQRTSLEKHFGLSDTLDDVEPNPGGYAAIMANNKPDPRGPGYIKLYLLAGTIFLCSTMSG